MARPKKGTKEAEEATRKWRETMQRKYGGAAGVHNMMSRIGRIGGQNGSGPDYKGGFASNPKLAREMGKRVGRISKRGFKYLGTEGEYRKYLDKKTGKVVKYPA